MQRETDKMSDAHTGRVSERSADEYEKAIRKKVFDAKILTPGEWVYLVGAFQAATDAENTPAQGAKEADGGVIDNVVHWPEFETPEPTIRDMVIHYYAHYMRDDPIKAIVCADRFLRDVVSPAGKEQELEAAARLIDHLRERVERLTAALEKIGDPLLLPAKGCGIAEAMETIRLCQTIALAALTPQEPK